MNKMDWMAWSMMDTIYVWMRRENGPTCLRQLCANPSFPFPFFFVLIFSTADDTAALIPLCTPTDHGHMVRFGHVVVGPPGSGKTTYCFGMFQYLEAIGRDAAVINLDPANHGEGVPYTPAVDIEELVSLEV